MPIFEAIKELLVLQFCVPLPNLFVSFSLIFISPLYLLLLTTLILQLPNTKVDMLKVLLLLFEKLCAYKRILQGENLCKVGDLVSYSNCRSSNL